MSVYQLDRPLKGLACIINNLHNEQKATRGDVTNLEKMFKKLNITHEVKINLGKDELNTLANDLKDKNLSSYNLYYLVVLSHGVSGDRIVCQNGTATSTFDIEFFVESLAKNKSMTGYPKILIFDFCRGGNVNLGELRAAVTTPPKIPVGSDIFIGFATTSGYAAVTGSTGSPFIDAFCESVERLFNKEQFICIFQEVQNVVSQRVTRVREPTKGAILDAMQVPELRSTLRKQLYLLDESNFFEKM